MWNPTIIINGRPERLTLDIADRKARGKIKVLDHLDGQPVSFKLTPRLWAYYEQAKTDGYIVLPDQRRGTFPLRDCWFTWTEASYHPYVYVQKKRGDKWLVSMDNIAFYDGRGPLYLLNTPERYAQSVRLLRSPFLNIAVHNRVSLSSSPYVLVQLDVLGFERAAYVARVLVRTGKAALSTAMKAQQKAAESEPTTKAIM